MFTVLSLEVSHPTIEECLAQVEAVEAVSSYSCINCELAALHREKAELMGQSLPAGEGRALAAQLAELEELMALRYKDEEQMHLDLPLSIIQSLEGLEGHAGLGKSRAEVSSKILLRRGMAALPVASSPGVLRPAPEAHLH